MSHHHDFTLDQAHAHGNGDGFSGSAHGTFHGDHNDIHVGGNVSHQHGGGTHGGVDGGFTHHPTPDSSISLHGGVQDNGNWNAGVTATIHF